MNLLDGYKQVFLFNIPFDMKCKIYSYLKYDFQKDHCVYRYSIGVKKGKYCYGDIHRSSYVNACYPKGDNIYCKKHWTTYQANKYFRNLHGDEDMKFIGTEKYEGYAKFWNVKYDPLFKRFRGRGNIMIVHSIFLYDNLKLDDVSDKHLKYICSHLNIDTSEAIKIMERY